MDCRIMFVILWVTHLLILIHLATLWIIYSRRVIDKTDWANTIDPYMETARFNTTINTGTEKLMKTVAQQV